MPNSFIPKSFFKLLALVLGSSLGMGLSVAEGSNLGTSDASVCVDKIMEGQSIFYEAFPKLEKDDKLKNANYYELQWSIRAAENKHGIRAREIYFLLKWGDKVMVLDQREREASLLGPAARAAKLAIIKSDRAKLAQEILDAEIPAKQERTDWTKEKDDLVWNAHMAGDGVAFRNLPEDLREKEKAIDREKWTNLEREVLFRSGVCGKWGDFKRYLSQQLYGLMPDPNLPRDVDLPTVMPVASSLLVKNAVEQAEKQKLQAENADLRKALEAVRAELAAKPKQAEKPEDEYSLQELRRLVIEATVILRSYHQYILDHWDNDLFLNSVQTRFREKFVSRADDMQRVFHLIQTLIFNAHRTDLLPALVDIAQLGREIEGSFFRITEKDFEHLNTSWWRGSKGIPAASNVSHGNEDDLGQYQHSQRLRILYDYYLSKELKFFEAAIAQLDHDILSKNEKPKAKTEKPIAAADKATEKLQQWVSHRDRVAQRTRTPVPVATSASVPANAQRIPGTDIALLHELGDGTYGHVFLGVDGYEYVAIKKINDGEGNVDAVRAGIAQIQKAMAGGADQVSRPLKLFQDDHGTWWLKMELVDGADLRKILATEKLSAANRVEAFQELLDALEKLHKADVPHIDLKPSNFMLDKHGRGVLVDAGSKGPAGDVERSKSVASRHGPVVTPKYDLPGQPLDILRDIGVLGFTWNEAVVGEFPEGSDLPSERIAHNPSLQEIWGTKENEKYPGAIELLDKIDRGLRTARNSPNKYKSIAEIRANVDELQKLIPEMPNLPEIVARVKAALVKEREKPAEPSTPAVVAKEGSRRKEKKKKKSRDRAKGPTVDQQLKALNDKKAREEQDRKDADLAQRAADLKRRAAEAAKGEEPSDPAKTGDSAVGPRDTVAE